MPLNLPASPEAIVAWGIDLGTTNTTLCCASLPTGATSPTEPEVVSLPQPTIAGTDIGSLLPSMVATHEGREFVGQGAKDLRALMADPKYGLVRNVNLFYECKNEIGTARSYPNAPPDYRSPTEIAARILAYVRREGNREGGGDNVVVTVPASFQAAQRAETMKACAAAGLDVSGGRLLDEPVAACIDYAYRHDPTLLDSVTDRSRLLLVFDFGGGICDTEVKEQRHCATCSPPSVASLATRSLTRRHESA